jgi:hypothetical protein
MQGIGTLKNIQIILTSVACVVWLREVLLPYPQRLAWDYGHPGNKCNQLKRCWGETEGHAGTEKIIVQICQHTKRT